MDDYGQQWKEYRRRWVFFVAIVALHIPVLMLLTILSFKLFHTDKAFPYIGGLWLVLWIVPFFRVLTWRCPRCRKRFIGGWWFLAGGWWFASLWGAGAARRCAGCGLERPEKVLAVFPPRNS